MTLKNVELLQVQNSTKPSIRQRLSNIYLKIGAGTTVSALAVTSANAAEGDFIEVLTTKIQGVATGINTLYGVAILVVAAIITWGILKRGANKV